MCTATVASVYFILDIASSQRKSSIIIKLGSIKSDMAMNEQSKELFMFTPECREREP